MIETYELVLIPIITGLILVFTSVGMPKKYSPLISLALGILGGVFYLFPESIKDGVLYGIMFGLSAVGFYSGTKNVKESVKDGSK